MFADGADCFCRFVHAMLSNARAASCGTDWRITEDSVLGKLVENNVIWEERVDVDGRLPCGGG